MSVVRMTQLRKMKFLALIQILLIKLEASNPAVIPRPDSFYGSEALLDGYCDDAQHFIDAFTLPSVERLTVEVK